MRRLLGKGVVPAHRNTDTVYPPRELPAIPLTAPWQAREVIWLDTSNK
jgi:hypothetical protein